MNCKIGKTQTHLKHVLHYNTVRHFKTKWCAYVTLFVSYYGLNPKYFKLYDFSVWSAAMFFGQGCGGQDLPKSWRRLWTGFSSCQCYIRQALKVLISDSRVWCRPPQVIMTCNIVTICPGWWVTPWLTQSDRLSALWSASMLFGQGCGTQGLPKSWLVLRRLTWGFCSMSAQRRAAPVPFSPNRHGPGNRPAWVSL